MPTTLEEDQELFTTFPNPAKDVDVLKLCLTHYDTLYTGLVQQDASEGLLMLIDVIMPYSHNDLTGISISDFLFWFILFI